MRRKRFLLIRESFFTSASLCAHSHVGVSLMRGRGEGGISFEELGALLGITSAKVRGRGEKGDLHFAKR